MSKKIQPLGVRLSSEDDEKIIELLEYLRSLAKNNPDMIDPQNAKENAKQKAIQNRQKRLEKLRKKENRRNRGNNNG